jgi:hypothetical protein
VAIVIEGVRGGRGSRQDEISAATVIRHGTTVADYSPMPERLNFEVSAYPSVGMWNVPTIGSSVQRRVTAFVRV